MEPLGRFPRVLNEVPRENIEGPLRDFPRTKPKGNPKGDLQYFPEGLHEYSKELPRGSIHHDSSKGLSQIVILTYVLDQFSCLRQYCKCAGRQEASCRAERRPRQMCFGPQ